MINFLTVAIICQPWYCCIIDISFCFFHFINFMGLHFCCW